MASIDGLKTDKNGNLLDIAVVHSGSGTRIFAIPLETFPNHRNNVYFIDDAEWPTLVDLGTRGSHEQLVAAFERLRDEHGVAVGLDSLRMAFLTHAHGDHFGNAHYFGSVGVPVVGHPLADRTLRNLKYRLPLYRRNLGLMCARAGCSDEERRSVVEAPYFDFEPFRLSELVRDGDRVGPGWLATHVPGHAPGQLTLQVDDVLFTADHVLSRITPAQAPGSLRPWSGVETYAASLRKTRGTSAGLLGLGGHESPMTDIPARIDETLDHHTRRLREIFDLCADGPKTVSEIQRQLFGEFRAHGLILALSEAQAHVEHLLNDGFLDHANSAEPGLDVADALLHVQRHGAKRQDISA